MAYETGLAKSLVVFGLLDLVLLVLVAILAFFEDGLEADLFAGVRESEEVFLGGAHLREVECQPVRRGLLLRIVVTRRWWRLKNERVLLHQSAEVVRQRVRRLQEVELPSRSLKPLLGRQLLILLEPLGELL